MIGNAAVARIRALKVVFSGGVVLRYPDLDVAAGEQLVLTGPSGSGKSTLLHVLAGLRPPASGVVEVGGQDLSSLSPAALERARSRRVGIVYQELHLAAGYSALENVTVALAAVGITPHRAAVRARDLLTSLDLGERLHARPGRLSAGERQRVAIARAVAVRPLLLLADEPTAHLDTRRAEAGLDLLVETAAKAGAALVVTTHDPAVIARFERQVALA